MSWNQCPLCGADRKKPVFRGEVRWECGTVLTVGSECSVNMADILEAVEDDPSKAIKPRKVKPLTPE